MPEKITVENEESAAFKRQFKYALYASAIVEFIVIALMVYSKIKR